MGSRPKRRPRRPLIRPSPQALVLGLALLATLGLVLASEKGSYWLTARFEWLAGRPEEPEMAYSVATAPANWPAIGAEAAGYLQTYLRFDTGTQPGQGQAAQWLHGVLRDAGIESRLVAGVTDHPGVLARLPGQGDGRPLVLYSHIELPPVDAGQWSMPPFEGALRDGYLYGPGAVQPKGHTIANLMAMLVVQRLRVPLQRDLVFLAAGSEWDLGTPGDPLLAEIERLQPELVLGLGGGNLELQPGQRGWMVSTFSKGYLHLRVGPARLGPTGSGSLPNGAHEQLARAVGRLIDWQAPIRSSPTTDEFFRRVASQYPFPLRDILAHPQVWPRVVAPQLLGDPAAADRLRDTVRLVRLEPWPDDPLCPSAVFAVYTMPGETPEQILDELKGVLKEPRLRFQILGQAEGRKSPWDTALSRAIEATAHRQDPRTSVLPSGDRSAGNRFFRARGVVCYGFLPFDLPPEELHLVGEADERLPANGLEQGVHRMVEVILDACAGL